MATCKDCIYYDILCKDTLQDNELELCDSFKNKADFVEVKHGYWLLDGRCSECLANPLTTHKSYCPNCGAKMDGERRDT
jgi:hypothetical protein